MGMLGGWRASWGSPDLRKRRKGRSEREKKYDPGGTKRKDKESSVNERKVRAGVKKEKNPGRLRNTMFQQSTTALIQEIVL